MTRILRILTTLTLAILPVLPLVAQRENTVYQTIWTNISGLAIDNLPLGASNPVRNIGQTNHLVIVRCDDNIVDPDDTCANLPVSAVMWIEGSYDNFLSWTQISRVLRPRPVTGGWGNQGLYTMVASGAFPYIRIRASTPIPTFAGGPGMTDGPLFSAWYSGTVGGPEPSEILQNIQLADSATRPDGIARMAFNVTNAGDNIVAVADTTNSRMTNIVKLVLWNSGGANTIVLRECATLTELLRLENVPQFTGLVLPGDKNTPALILNNGLNLCINLSAATRVTGYVLYRGE